MRSFVVTVLFACSSSATPPTPAPAPTATGDALVSGRPIERAISTGEVHRYKIHLDRGQVATGVIDQRGIDVVVSTFDRAGRKLEDIDSDNGANGPEPFVIDANAAGDYPLEVHVLPGEAQHGRYEARVVEITTHAAYVERHAHEVIRSPRLFRLWQDLAAGRRAAVAAFWTELDHKAPLVEPFPGDPHDVLVTFVYRLADPTLHVTIYGGPTAREKPLVRLADSDVWYLTARMPADARFSYNFVVSADPLDFQDDYLVPKIRVARRRGIGDPLNPTSTSQQASVELRAAPAQPWVQQTDAPKGELKRITIESDKLHEKRIVAIYTPPGFDPTRTYPLLVAFDGEWFGMDESAGIPVPRILDNMIAAKQLPPMVAALVANQGTRERDLLAKPFADFVALELVPFLRREYHAGNRASETIVAGSSLGGWCAISTALDHSEVIGNVLSQSAALDSSPEILDTETTYATERDSLVRTVVTSPRRPIRFYLDVGVFETDSVFFELLRENRRMRDVLEAKGYSVTYAELHGGHDTSVWRGTFSDGLRALTK
jgi:enterochelin esterase-like enzyme